MSILSALKETQHSNNNLDDLAKLPQALIMQMAQNGQIPKDMVMPILGKKAEMVETAAKMKAAQAIAQQGGAQPTVMEKYMGEIAAADHPAPIMPQQQIQQPMPQQMAQSPMPQGPEDVGIASQATAPMQMAGGGIIAFDDGGDVEDEEDRYDVYRKKAQRNADFSSINAMRHELEGMPVGENRGVGITAGHHGAERGMEGDLESRLRAAIMGKESGGKRYDKNGNLLTSHKGAQGEMQVMPGTAKDPGFGIKPAQNSHPDELRRVGDEYASVLLNRYQDPKLAMIAYNMGPGATDKWLASGADPRKLPKETQGYIRNVNLAQGGEVQHYAAGDYVGFGEEAPYDPESSWGIADWWKRNTPGSKEFVKSQEAEKKKAAPTKTTAAPAQAPAPQPRTDIPQSPEGIKNLQTKADDEAFNMMQYIKEQQAERKEAAKMDKWQAGLAAGLGMLGGTSQYALENIGKGGQMGVQQLAQSQKLRAAENKAAGELYGDAARMDLANKQRGDVLKERSREFNEKQTLASSDKLNAAIAAAKKAPQNATNMLMLNALESQFANGKLDPSKIAELERLRNWNKGLENSVRQNFAGASEGNGMRLVGVRG